MADINGSNCACAKHVIRLSETTHIYVAVWICVGGEPNEDVTGLLKILGEERRERNENI